MALFVLTFATSRLLGTHNSQCDKKHSCTTANAVTIDCSHMEDDMVIKTISGVKTAGTFISLGNTKKILFSNELYFCFSSRNVRPQSALFANAILYGESDT